MSEQNLPSGWTCSTLGLVCSKLTDGSHNPPKGTAVGQPMLSAKNIQNGIIDFRQSHRLIPAELFESEDRRTRVSAHDVLLTIVGALGRTAVVPENCGKFTLQRSVAVLAAPGLNTRAFRYSLESYDFQKQILDNAKGTAQKGIYLKKLRELTVPIPPLAEQKVIADKLDTLLAQVENTKARLERIPKILKRFRQSVLAAAVSGRLTEEWRNEADYSNWSDVQLDKICSSISDGDHQAPPRAQKGIPFLVISNVAGGDIDFDNVSRWVPEDYYNSLKNIRKPSKNDLLYTVTGSFGIPVVVDTEQAFCFQRHIAIIKPDHDVVSSRYLAFYLRSPKVFAHAVSVATGTAQKTVSLTNLRKFLVSLPTMEEQTEIVRRVDQLFAHADRIEQQVNNALARVNNLTQSILAKAFRGELTEQWRMDNPELLSGENSAEALLERIKAERAAAQPAKRTRKRKASA